MEQQGVVLCDTDVIIEFYKGNSDIIKELKRMGQDYLAISVITAGELPFGKMRVLLNISLTRLQR